MYLLKKEGCTFRLSYYLLISLVSHSLKTGYCLPNTCIKATVIISGRIKLRKTAPVKLIAMSKTALRLKHAVKCLILQNALYLRSDSMYDLHYFTVPE